MGQAVSNHQRKVILFYDLLINFENEVFIIAAAHTAGFVAINS